MGFTRMGLMVCLGSTSPCAGAYFGKACGPGLYPTHYTAVGWSQMEMF